MSIDQKIKNSVFEAIDEINMLLPKEKKITKSLDSDLFGKQKLDSLSIINFIIAIERNINSKLSIENFYLINESLSEQDLQKFKDVSSLIGFIKSKLNI